MIEVKEVTVTYKKKTALNQASFCFGEKTYVLLGPNGSGKTTLFRCMTRNIPNYKGSIICGAQSYYINMFLQFFVPPLFTIPVLEKVKPHLTRQIGEIISGRLYKLFQDVLWVQILCILYMRFLGMVTGYLTDNTGDICRILIFQTLLFQGASLLVFLLSGTVYTACMLPFLLQMLSVFMMIQGTEYPNLILITGSDHDVNRYFMQRWYCFGLLAGEWPAVYLLFRNRFRVCKWL